MKAGGGGGGGGDEPKNIWRNILLFFDFIGINYLTSQKHLTSKEYLTGKEYLTSKRRWR